MNRTAFDYREYKDVVLLIRLLGMLAPVQHTFSFCTKRSYNYFIFGAVAIEAPLATGFGAIR